MQNASRGARMRVVLCPRILLDWNVARQSAKVSENTFFAGCGVRQTLVFQAYHYLQLPLVRLHFITGRDLLLITMSNKVFHSQTAEELKVSSHLALVFREMQ